MLKRQDEEEQLFREKHPESDVIPNERPEESEEEQAERWEQEEKYFFWKRSSPGADVDKILDRINNGIRADQALFYVLSSIGREFPADVMSLSYVFQNHSRPLVRMIISLVYFAGFALLSIPTLFTFVSVIRQTIS